jgi:hypothetical protein
MHYLCLLAPDLYGYLKVYLSGQVGVKFLIPSMATTYDNKLVEMEKPEMLEDVEFKSVRIMFDIREGLCR